MTGVVGHEWSRGDELVVGVDTHQDEHVAVVIDRQGVRLGGASHGGDHQGGHRHANAALHRIVVVRLRYEERTQAYMRRRITEGMSKAEVIRCLKRYGRSRSLRRPAELSPTPKHSLTSIGASGSYATASPCTAMHAALFLFPKIGKGEQPMSPEEHRGLEAKPETDGRREVIEMHLFDDDAAEEKALCEADTSDDNRRSVKFYLEGPFAWPLGWRRLRGVQSPSDAVRREARPGPGGRGPAR